MRVLEIKNNLVKVSYSVEDNLVLAGFVVIDDENSPYVAQVVSLKADNNTNYAIVRLIFTFDTEGIVKSYDGTIPSLNASISQLSAAELLDILPINTPLKLGNLSGQDFLLNIDSSVLEKNLLICSDNQTNTNIIIENLVKQLENREENSVVFDISGDFKNNQKLIFGQDFKLPLNFETINFIYANDLNDIDATSKAVIQDIFLEVQQYTRTIPDKFIPFDSFIDVVSAQYKESNMPELALLKNKLLKYKEENVFAQSNAELKKLKEFIKDNYTVVLDISTAEEKLQREIIFYVYNMLAETNPTTYSFIKVNNSNSDKKLLKLLLAEDNIHTNITCNHNYKYVYELKEQASNLILFAPQTTQHDFATYNTFLNKLNPDEFIVWGKATQTIPLLVELSPVSIVDMPAKTQQKHEIDARFESARPSELKEPLNFASTEEPDDFSDSSNTYADFSDDIQTRTLNNDPNSAFIEEPIPFEEQSELLQDAPEQTQTPLQEPNPFATRIEPLPFASDDITNDDSEIISEEPFIEEEIIEDETFTEELPELIHPVKTTLIEVEDEFQDDSENVVNFSQLEDRDALVEQVAKDIDETFIYSKLEHDNLEDETQDILTEDDLNFIEDINQNEHEEDFDQSFEEGFEQNFEQNIDSSNPEIVEEFEEEYITESETPPVVVPVYPTEKLESSQTFEQGDHVSHPKYGEGIVEKMIKYGSKTLCSINFADIGRRLLDPAISEITKL